MKAKLKKFKSVFHKKSGKKRGDLINPLKAWTVSLISAVIIFVLGVAFSAVDFYLQLVSPQEIVLEEKPLVYRESEVREFADLYNQKAETFNEMRIQLRQPARAPIEETTGEETVAEEAIDE